MSGIFVLFTQVIDILQFSTKCLQAVFFDFDGVLVDSVPLKTAAYAEIFEPYGDGAVREIIAYHKKYGGIDRYRKIHHISNVIGLNLNEKIVQQMVEKFSYIVKEQIIAMPLVSGARKLLVNLQSCGIKQFIVSGTPQEELQDITRSKDITSYFQEICGSPLTKKEIVRAILARYQLDAKKCVFVGDALGDFEAALSVGMFFAGIPASEDRVKL